MKKTEKLLALLLVLLLAATALLGRRLFPDTTENGEET